MEKKGILERLKDGPVLGAEGYLFELERRGYVKAGPSAEALGRSVPASRYSPDLSLHPVLGAGLDGLRKPTP